MPRPIDTETRFKLEALGYNPDDYEIADPEDLAPTSAPTTATVPSERSTAGILGRQAATAIGPGAAALGVGARVTAATFPYLKQYSLIPGIIAGGGAGILAGMGQQKLLEKFTPGFAQEVKQDVVEAPKRSALGNIAGSLAFLKPDPKALVGAGRALLNPARGVVPHAADVANLGNVGVGAGIGAGQSLLEDYQRGEGVDLGKLALNMGGNALLNNPNRLGQTLGMAPNVYNTPIKYGNRGESIPGMIAQQEAAQQAIDARKISQEVIGKKQYEPAAAIKQNILSPDLIQKEVPVRGGGTKIKEKVVPLKSAEESAAIIANPPKTSTLEYTLALKEKADQDLAASVAQEAEVKQQLAQQAKQETEQARAMLRGAVPAQDRPLTENQVKLVEPGLKEAVQPKFEQKSIEEVPEVKPKPTTQEPTLSEAEQIQEDFDLGRRNAEASEMQQNQGGAEARLAQAAEKNRVEEIRKMAKTLVGRGEAIPTTEWDESMGQLAKQRGVELKKEKVTDNKGNEILGNADINRPADMADAVARINPKRASLDIWPHETFHVFFNDIETGSSKLGKTLASKGLKVIEDSPEFKAWKSTRMDNPAMDAREFLAEDVGYDFVRRALKTDNKGAFKNWMSDFYSFVKTKYGSAGASDYKRLFSAKLMHDAPYSETGGKGGVLTKSVEVGEETKNSESSELTQQQKGGDNQNEKEIRQEDQRLLTKGGDSVSSETPRQSGESLLGDAVAQEPKTESTSTPSSAPTTKKLLTIPGMRSKVERVRAIDDPDASKLADAYDSFAETLREYRGKYINSVTRPLKDKLGIKGIGKEYLTQDSAKARRVLQYLDDMQDTGKSSIQLFGDEKAAADAIRKYNDMVLKEHNSREGLRKGGENPNYFQQVPDRKVLEIVLRRPDNDPKKQELMRDYYKYQESKGISEAKAKENFDLFRAGFDKQDVNLAKQFGPIDKASGLGIPQSWREKNLIERLARYGERVARRFAYYDTMQSKPDIMAAHGKLRTMEAVQNVEKDVAGIRPEDEMVRSAMVGVIRAGMLGTLTGTKDFAANLTLGLQHQDMSQAVPAIASAWKNMKQNIADSYRLGLTRDSINSLEIGDEGFGNMISILHRTRDVLSDVQGRNFLEKITRATAFGQGKFLTIDNFQNFKNGKLSKQGRKFLDDFAPGNWQTKNNLTSEDIDKIAARYVESVQGTYDMRGLPSVATEGTLAPFLMLARWNIEKTNNFVKHVVNPALNGDLKPLLMSTIGMFVGGSTVQQIVQSITGRKDKTASVEEIEAGKEKIPAVAYKLAGLASASGYAGILGDVSRTIMDSTYGKTKPQEYNNLLVDAAANLTDKTLDLVTAINNGEDLDVVADYIQEVVADHFQLFRLSQRFWDKDSAQKVERGNKFRDLRTYNLLEGNDVTDLTSMGEQNTFVDRDIRRFKQTKDLNEAIKLWPKIAKKMVEDSEGNEQKLEMKLRSLKGNSYQVMPNPKTLPDDFEKYVKFLEKTQGTEKAKAVLVDYITQNELNKTKSKMVP